MSTYLSGSPTYLPTVQPFQPNLQLFAGALQFKQTQYDTNRKKISDLYGSLLNSPLSRDSNVQAREEFFKSIDYEIKKLTNVDLSLQQNVNQAAGLFNAMYDNKNIVKDMMWTKNYNNEMQRAEGFRNCLDPEKCGGQYWEGGVQALDWKRDEFRKLSDEDAMMMGDVKYTPYVNVQDMAAKMFKEMDWDVKMDTPDGMWIVTTKNGQLIEGNLLAHFQKTLGEDPRVNEYYKTKAYLERKNWAAANAGQYGSQEAAEQEYINQTTAMVNESLAKAKEQVAHQKQTNKQIANDLKENVDNGDILYDQQVQSVMDELFGDADNYEATENQIGNVLGSANNSVATRTMSLQGEAVDNAVAMMFLDEDLKVAAHTMAFTKYEQTLKENPIAMAEQEHRWRMEEIAYEDSLKEKKAEEEMTGNDLLNEYFAGETREVINLDPKSAYEMINKDIRDEISQAKTPTLDVLTTTFAAAQEKANSGGNGSAQAGQDIVAIVDQAIRSKLNAAKYSKDSAKYEYAKKLQKKWNSKSASEKLGWAKQWNMEEFTSTMPYDAIYKTYNVASKMYDNTPYNLSNRSYLNEVKSQMGQLVQLANDGNRDVTALRKTRKELTQKVSGIMVREGGENSEYYRYLANEQGDTRSMDGFAFTAAMGLTQKEYKEDPVTRWRKENQAEASNIEVAAKNRWQQQMSPERKAQFGNNMQAYVNQALKEAARKSSSSNPTVRIVENGQAKYIGIDEFFTADGLVRSKYEKYKKSWKPGQQSAFWTTYKEAQRLYSGAETYEESYGVGDALADAFEVGYGFLTLPMRGVEAAIAGDASIANPFQSTGSRAKAQWERETAEALQKARTDKKFTSTFIEDWKKAHVNALNEVKKEGFGSYTAKDLTGLVDYSNPKSKAVMGDQSFLLNAFEAEGTKDAIFTFGGPQNQIPLASDAGASDFVKKIMQLALKNIDKEGRPTWSGTFNKFGGGKEDWQQYTIRINETSLINAFGKGTEEYAAMYDLFGEGKRGDAVTIYLKDSAANNELHKATKLSAMEKQFQYKKTVPIVTGYYDDMHTLKLTKTADGGYKLDGGILQSIENGVKNYQPVSYRYDSNAYSPDAIRAIWMQNLEQIRNDFK